MNPCRYTHRIKQKVAKNTVKNHLWMDSHYDSEVKSSWIRFLLSKDYVRELRPTHARNWALVEKQSNIWSLKSSRTDRTVINHLIKGKYIYGTCIQCDATCCSEEERKHRIHSILVALKKGTLQFDSINRSVLGMPACVSLGRELHYIF